MEQIIRYRTETFSGLGERDAAEVMAFETFELQNTDILETLINTLLKDSPICAKLKRYVEELNDNGFVEDITDEDAVQFFNDVLIEIQRITGIQVRYALWLADFDTVKNFYGKYIRSEDDIEAYYAGPVILSELGYDGALYGYPELPKCIGSKF